jgi:HTH-type transcriptional regulator / antitoxin HipB
MLRIKDINKLADLIRETRKKQGISQEDLAGLSNTGVRFIVDLEKAKATCQVEKVFQVINALGLEFGVKQDD